MIEIIIVAVLSGIIYIASKVIDTRSKTEALKKIAPAVSQWQEITIEAAAPYKLPWQIVLAQIWQESVGDPDAQGSAGEIGLMQLKPGAIIDIEQFGYGRFDDYDINPKVNVKAGASYLDLNMRSGRAAGDIHLALRMYNQGPTGALSKMKAVGSELTKEQLSIKYADKVFQKAKLIGY